LPDGIKSQFWEDFGLPFEFIMLVYFMTIFVYFTTVWYILCPFGLFCSYLAYFFPLWYVSYVVPRKLWQPWIREVPGNWCCRQRDRSAKLIWLANKQIVGLIFETETSSRNKAVSGNAHCKNKIWVKYSHKRT
jgi:hypothetical protein